MKKYCCVLIKMLQMIELCVFNYYFSFLHRPKKKQKSLALDCSTTRYFLNSEIKRTPPKAFGVKQRLIFSESSKSGYPAATVNGRCRPTSIFYLLFYFAFFQ